MALAEVVRAGLLPFGTRFPDEVVIVLGDEVCASASVTDIPEDLMPRAGRIGAFE
jgi:hypothetical protein